MYGNPYYNQQQRYQPMQPQQPIQPMQPQPYMQPIIQQQTLLGKVVDNIEVVRAIDIPLDGSTSFFPLADNSAIITKQLQSDGTSKIVVYKPTNDEKETSIKYATIEDIQDALNDLDISDIQDIQDLKDDVKEIKKQLKELKIKSKGE